MVKIIKTNGLIIGIISIIVMANISMAAVELTVAPDNGTIVVQGGTINYTATVLMTEQMVNPITGEIIPQEEVFSIDEVDKQPGWTYVFDPEKVVLENVEDINTSKLTINVSKEASPGNYTHTVLATGSDGVSIDAEVDPYVINTAVAPVPELNTIILTSAGLLGLLAAARRTNNEKNRIPR